MVRLKNDYFNKIFKKYKNKFGNLKYFCYICIVVL